MCERDQEAVGAPHSDNINSVGQTGLFFTRDKTIVTPMYEFVILGLGGYFILVGFCMLSALAAACMMYTLPSNNPAADIKRQTKKNDPDPSDPSPEAER